MSALVIALLLAAEPDAGASLQQRVAHRAHRFELAPSLAVSVNDPFFTRLGGALRAAFHLSETFTVAVRGAYFAAVPTDDVVVARSQLGAVQRPLATWLAMADAEWAPMYGKFVAADSIVHFDVFAVAGLGVAVGQPAFDLGGGVRLSLRDALSFNVALIDTAYLERAALVHALMLSAGFAVLLPFTSAR